jgi:5-hydroxyisourate hydrolase-like protein (transthyretin family)
MKGKLSTHVLDTTGGRPAAGVSIDVWSCQEGKRLDYGRDLSCAVVGFALGV